MSLSDLLNKTRELYEDNNIFSNQHLRKKVDFFLKMKNTNPSYFTFLSEDYNHIIMYPKNIINEPKE